MRIDPTTFVAITDARERPAAGRPAAAGSPSAVVALGEAASSAQETGADPQITARMARIREELTAGTYVVDLDKLSERILDDELARSA